MSLKEMIQQLDELSPEELNELQSALDQRQAVRQPQDRLTPQERVRGLRSAAHTIREGFTDAEWAQIELDMNGEYIEPVDDEQWKD